VKKLNIPIEIRRDNKQKIVNVVTLLIATDNRRNSKYLAIKVATAAIIIAANKDIKAVPTFSS